MQIKFAHDHKNIKSFEECVEQLKPTAIIGLAGAGKLFSKSILEKMAKYNERTGPKLFCVSPRKRKEDHILNPI